jgi:L-aspartate oxidase
MEFIQFHPTVFFREGAPRFLISEAVRGEGAVLRNAKGERFLRRTHPDAELAPRDVVSRAIQFELDRSGARCVYIDATGIPPERFQTRFPTIVQFLAAFALDPSKDLIPITPAAHYTIGGVATDLAGRTSLPGLLAVGEVAATGVHGANRLASNSLLEGLVFGEHVARQLVDPHAGGPTPPAAVREVPVAPGQGREEAAEMLATIHAALWEQVGIVRNAQGMADAIRTLDALAERAEPPGPKGLPGPGANATLTARLITEAARAREESRGAHYRSDRPRPRASWRHHLGLVRKATAPDNG